jgi:tetratricopeptide (TPR) repeat protein
MVRRHRTGTVATIAVLLALLMTLAAVTAGYLRVRAVVDELNKAYIASHLAESDQARQADVANKAQREERERGREFDASQRFYHEFIQAAAHDGGETARLRAAVDEAVHRMGGELAEQRLLEASLRHTIGTVYWQLGDLEKASAMLLRAKELRCGFLPGSHPGELPIVARSLYSLAIVRIALGKTDEGRTLLLEALSLRDPRFKENGMSPDDPLQVDILHALALLAIDGHALVEADARSREALTLARRLEPDGGWMTVRSLRLLADVFQQMGDLNAATPLRTEAEAMARQLPADTTRDALPHPEGLATPR